MERDIVIEAQDIYLLNLILTKIVDLGQCDIAMVINKSGRLISYQSEANVLDKISIAALVSGSFASSGAIANLIGEKEFETLYQEGAVHHLYVAQVDENNILTIIFTDRSNLKRIKTAIDDHKSAMLEILTKIYSTVVADPFLNLDVSSYKSKEK
ncbi:MAG: roadblock/LC7 domain-containing protein [Chitinivibrionia bacterium]|nr:roadblock/LC7 domain-containing protein [Chitinivibrionia bacterium]